MKEDNQTWWYLLQKEIPKHLHEYRQNGVIDDFYLTSNAVIENESFAYTITIGQRQIIFDIYNAHKVNGVACELAEARATTCAIKVYQTADAEEVCLEILSSFENRTKILDRESIFKIILAPKFIFKLSTSLEDMMGIDGYIRKKGEDRWMPIQLKSTLADLEAHKIAYPNIPGIAYTHKTDWKKVRRYISRIYRIYFSEKEVLCLSAIE